MTTSGTDPLASARQLVDVAQLLHGGWRYSGEGPVSCHVVDALVLPIFEGTKPILEPHVIARGLLAAIAR